MTHVLISFCDPARPCLTAGHIAAMGSHLPQAAAPRQLDEGIAAEIAFTPTNARAEAITVLGDDLRARFCHEPIDIAIVPAIHRRKKLFLADMDSTMIRQECIDELAAELDLKPRVAAITEQAMRGEIPFEGALRERVALLAGLPVATIDKIIAERIELMPGGPVLVATLRASGVYTALVSGGFTLFTGPIATRLGFHEHRSNTLIVADGKLTGKIADPILGAEAKRQALGALALQLSLQPDETLAVGDGANDLPMLNAAGFGVAFHAKPKVAEACAIRIEHGDLTALLYLQGFTRAEFAR
ncbi:phosphoserine phosphatase SerB [Candidatus Raskinella chloraquaticus]|uniref:Phosphoserine phosphatase n=1 Tax=Candidatus Raskinella chloraquaticus TaxID=1951219 RepID=A0A1W9HXP6_9HYPH|nr:MAG: phosphoserine phosphatase [Proteobacteria bacterium SG_bin8]